MDFLYMNCHLDHLLSKLMGIYCLINIIELFIKIVIISNNFMVREFFLKVDGILINHELYEDSLILC